MKVSIMKEGTTQFISERESFISFSREDKFLKMMREKQQQDDDDEEAKG